MERELKESQVYEKHWVRIFKKIIYSLSYLLLRAVVLESEELAAFNVCVAHTTPHIRPEQSPQGIHKAEGACLMVVTHPLV